MSIWTDRFSTPQKAKAYAEGPPRFLPGFEAMHRMAVILLSEHMQDEARLLVLGAGGGLELKAFAQARPNWEFTGVDPAIEMLKLAQETLGPLATRVDLVEGYIDDAPSQLFDGATSLLTLHFLEPEERLRTLTEIRKRLRPGAPFVAVHSSFCQNAQMRQQWIARYAAFAIESGAEPDMVAGAKDAVSQSTTMLEPEHDMQLMREAGFSDIQQFFSAFTWAGWVARA